MGIQVEWDNNEKTIIRYILVSPWAWEDIRDAAEASNHMLDEVGRKVHFIYDMRESTGVPDGAITNLRRYVGKEHPLTGQSVVVGTSKTGAMLLARGILSMVQRVYKAEWGFWFADSLEAAREMLATLKQEPSP
jgi:hypothetical protein